MIPLLQTYNSGVDYVIGQPPSDNSMTTSLEVVDITAPSRSLLWYMNLTGDPLVGQLVDDEEHMDAYPSYTLS